MEATQEEPAPRFTTCLHEGFTQVNNQWRDEMLSQIKHFGEYKVVDFVIRHTEGFHQKEVCLTIEEFVHGRKRSDGTRIDRGIRFHERWVQDGINKAIEEGYIRRRMDGKRFYYSLSARSCAHEHPTDAGSCTHETHDPAPIDAGSCTHETYDPAPIDALETSPEGHPQERKNNKRNSKERERKPVTTSKPEIVLSEKAQAVYHAWCDAPWFRGVAPRLTQTVADHCTTLATYDPLPTTEDMIKVRHWYTSKYPGRKGFELGNFVGVYPQYLSEQYQPKPIPRPLEISPEVLQRRERAERYRGQSKKG